MSDTWPEQAICATPQYEGHANLWFPNPEDREAITAAKRVCASCPVRLACLSDALAEEGSRHAENRFGIRGGQTSEDRYRLYARSIRARRRQAEEVAV
ncbi:WhiB family transcriptional regulator [Streptomyces spinosisporus]|uniref:WhiB family transcriptional regulator n=1 Tax=Streptomyces spinosisporus TaxID=2927582 RepID=A0ABS9XWN0_9ACTN|nr:WhiB family transcriptional regulator [Streptomyces spinosisporus]MCI3246493.1 WhiB family transcriptional regulator [Streptomyces spinosisporus]